MIAAVADTLRGRWIATGPRVAAFEKGAVGALRRAAGPRAHVRDRGDAGGARAARHRPGDEVIIPAQSFFGPGNVIERAGATAVFVDVNLGSRNIDLEQAAAAVTPKTRLLFPTHYHAPLDPDALGAFAERHKVRVLEDAAARDRIAQLARSRWERRATSSRSAFIPTRT